MKRLCVVGALVLAAVGCGEDGPTFPIDRGDVSGTWTGNYSSASFGTGTVELRISQNGSFVNGTWSTRAGLPGYIDQSGTVDGLNTSTGSSGTLTIDFIPGNPRECPYRGAMTYFSTGGGNGQMTGTIVTYNCTVNATTSVILNRRF